MRSIKTYQLFKESQRTIAEEIISLSEDDSYAQSLISQYCQDFDTSIDSISTINMLDQKTQEKILNLIKKYKLKKEDDAIINTHTDLNLLESVQSFGGENLFSCFLKVFTSLGFKDIKPNWESIPNDYLLYYITNNIEYLDIRLVTSRYKFLDKILEDINQSTQKAKIYFGLRCDMVVEYGISFDYTSNKIGEFNINSKSYESLMISHLLALRSFKSILNKIGFNRLDLMCKIRSSMNDFNPGYFEEKSNPKIVDDIITFGYYGIGKWDDGFMDNNEYESIKNNLRNFLIQFQWVENIKISVVVKDYWVYVNIKLKD